MLLVGALKKAPLHILLLPLILNPDVNDLLSLRRTYNYIPEI